MGVDLVIRFILAVFTYIKKGYFQYRENLRERRIPIGGLYGIRD